MQEINTNPLSFEWDDDKNVENIRKHGVSFGEAQTAFKDECAPYYFDPDHSHEEDRYLLIGMSSSHEILIVSHCYRDGDLKIRIISARKANENEKKEYRRYHA